MKRNVKNHFMYAHKFNIYHCHISPRPIPILMYSLVFGLANLLIRQYCQCQALCIWRQFTTILLSNIAQFVPFFFIIIYSSLFLFSHHHISTVFPCKPYMCVGEWNYVKSSRIKNTLTPMLCSMLHSMAHVCYDRSHSS